MFPARIIAVTGLLAALLACSGETQPTADTTEEKTADALPEGLVAFDDGKAPLKTAYVKDGTAYSDTCDDSGCRYVFGLPDEDGAPREDASVTFLFPANNPAVTVIRDTMIQGDNGVFAKHPEWVAGLQSGGNAAMPWLQQVTSFSANDTMVGRVMVGSAPMGNFLVTEVVNKQDLEQARPILAAIYQHLSFPESR
jgi:hypothetical protein